MNVSLDVSAVPARPVGAGRYTVELARAMAEADDLAIDLTLVTRVEDSARWADIAPGAPVVAAAPTRRPARLVWEQTGLPLLLRRLPVQLHHGPHYTMPEAARLPKVVTVHDLTFFSHPEWHERSKVPYFRRAIRVAARHASAVVCVSHATARELRRHCDPSVPVHVVPHGVDHERFNEGGDPARDEALLADQGIRRPFVGFLGTIEPRKDVATLVRAFERIAPRHRDLRLVIAGARGWGDAHVTEAIAASPFRDRIVEPGYLSDATLPALLRSAAAVAYPSLEEGFGLPALEALACGAPLVTTTGSAMEEVSAGAALLVEPGDVSGLSDALDVLVSGDPGLESRRAAGLRLAAGYTWAACAAGHAEVYRSVASRR